MKHKVAAMAAALTLITAVGSTAVLAEAPAAAANPSATIGLANPWSELPDLDTLNTAAGTAIKLPDRQDLSDVSFRLLNNGNNSLAEVNFTMNGFPYTLRASSDMTGDISGVYTANGKTAFEDSGDSRYEETAECKLIRWYQDGIQYVLMVKDDGQADLISFVITASQLQEDDTLLADWGMIQEEDYSVEADYTACIEPYYDVLNDMKDPELAEMIRADENSRNLMMAVDSGKYGYTIRDLDNDGHDELIIATQNPDDPFFGKMILRLVTNDGKDSHVVFESSERARYYYAGENRFAFVGSNSAFDSVETTYALVNNQLVDLGYATPESDYMQMDVETISVPDDGEPAAVEACISELNFNLDAINGKAEWHGMLTANNESAAFSVTFTKADVTEETVTSATDGRLMTMNIRTPMLGGLEINASLDLSSMEDETFNAIAETMIDDLLEGILNSIFGS